MSVTASAVFDSIESAHEYVGLLCEAVDEAESTIAEELTRSSSERRPRHGDALRLIDYKLKGLRHHLVSSRLILNDLRTLRRYLFEERMGSRPKAGAFANLGPGELAAVLTVESGSQLVALD
jgi:hypothetical protein